MEIYVTDSEYQEHVHYLSVKAVPLSAAKLTNDMLNTLSMTRMCLLRPPLKTPEICIPILCIWDAFNCFQFNIDSKDLLISQINVKDLRKYRMWYDFCNVTTLNLPLHPRHEWEVLESVILGDYKSTVQKTKVVQSFSTTLWIQCHQEISFFPQIQSFGILNWRTGRGDFISGYNIVDTTKIAKHTSWYSSIGSIFLTGHGLTAAVTVKIFDGVRSGAGGEAHHKPHEKQYSWMENQMFDHAGEVKIWQPGHPFLSWGETAF